MILVDASIWTDFLGGHDAHGAPALERIAEQGVAFGFTSVIHQEVLQGTASEQDFRKLDAYLRSQRFFHPLGALESHAAAAQPHADFRREGVTIRSTIDCLITQIFIEHDLLSPHDHKHYRHKAGVIPGLRLFDLAG
ncbi:MAG TPA: hypothetical protein VF171_00780 [Trueperaceae bacterium]